LPVTLDPVEFRSYQYHTGICITIFAPGRQAELGRGGRYMSGESEPATGITLYPDTIVRAAPASALRPRVFLPHGTGNLVAGRCRREGYATIAGLVPGTAPFEEAARLGCSHVWHGGAIIPLGEVSHG